MERARIGGGGQRLILLGTFSQMMDHYPTVLEFANA